MESSGAKVVPIKYDLPHPNLTKLFNSLNGVYIPGGNAALYQKD
mgnify:CR=1 FL=1